MNKKQKHMLCKFIMSNVKEKQNQHFVLDGIMKFYFILSPFYFLVSFISMGNKKKSHFNKRYQMDSLKRDGF